MTCLLLNSTPLPAAIVPLEDLEGRAGWLLLVKCTWRLSSNRLAAAEDQAPIRLSSDQRMLGALDLDDTQREALGKRVNEQIVWLDHELSPHKPAFDVLVAGYATAPDGHAGAHVDAGLRIGQRVVALRAHAPRRWRLGMLGVRPHALARTVKRVPLTYAVADWEGGIATVDRSAPVEALPWLESLTHPAHYGRAGQHPAAFGPWPTTAPHRKRHAGTYDEVWRAHRMPRPPRDFHPRFYNLAHPELQFEAPPAPGTEISLVHLARRPVIQAAMPHLDLAVRTTREHQLSSPEALRYDTLTIEPDLDRMSLTWRAHFPARTPAGLLHQIEVTRPALTDS